MLLKDGRQEPLLIVVRSFIALLKCSKGRKAQFIEELVKQDASKAQPRKKSPCPIDRLIYYAGWCDKYQQIFGTVNPVASSHFNFFRS
jgi:hypothetical protein